MKIVRWNDKNTSVTLYVDSKHQPRAFQNQNEKPGPKRYRARFIEPGIISYEDLNSGVVLIRRPALDRMISSFVGKPVYIGHQDIPFENAFDKDKPDEYPDPVGVISATGTDHDGWDYADMIIWDEEACHLIDEEGYTVSCSYIPTAVSDGGVYHNIRYDEEVTDGYYDHMALTDNPRYESAVIYQNSKEGKMAGLLKKLIQKKNEGAAPPPKKKEEPAPNETDMGYDNQVIEIDGQQIPLAEVIAAIQKEKENAMDVIGDEDMIEVDGEQISGADLKALYKSIMESTNSIDPQDTPGEPPVDEKLQNSKPVPSVKQDSPNENFNRVKFVKVKNSQPETPTHVTRIERIQKGTAKYASGGVK